jgi:hypothetical protein
MVYLFGGAVTIKLGGLLDAKFKKRGTIKQHFYAMDTISIVFLEIEKAFVAGRRKLDVMAQVLAELLSMPNFPNFPPPFFFRCVAALDFDSTANVSSVRLFKFEASTLGTSSRYPPRWREVRIPGLRLWHPIGLLVRSGHGRGGRNKQARTLDTNAERQ